MEEYPVHSKNRTLATTWSVRLCICTRFSYILEYYLGKQAPQLCLAGTSKSVENLSQSLGEDDK